MSTENDSLQQASHLLKLIAQQNLSTASLELLARYLPIVARGSGNTLSPPLVDDVLKCFGLTRDLTASLGNRNTAARLLSLPGRTVNEMILPRLPDKMSKPGRYNFKLYDPKGYLDREEVKTMICSDGFSPAPYDVGMAFVKLHFNEGMGRPIIFPGTLLTIHSIPFVIVVTKNAVDLCAVKDWHSYHVFLGFKPDD